MKDAVYAARTILRTPWYALTVIGVIGLGIALATTVFAIVDGVLFKPLPYADAQQLFSLSRGTGPSSPREVRAYQDAVPDARFTALHGIVGLGTMGVVNGPMVWSRAVDDRFWDVLGVRPFIGGFSAGDYTADPFSGPAVITYGLWQRLYGGDLNVIGKPLQFTRFPLRVAGVLPRDFVFPSDDRAARPDVLLPIADSGSSADASSRFLDVIVRLPAATRPIDVMPLLQKVSEDVRLTAIREELASRERPTAAIVLGLSAVIIVLVMINVGGLAVSRNADRVREISARRALGASRWSLVKLQLTEAGLLTMMGTIAGMLAARALLRLTTRLLPTDIVLLREPAIDLRVLGLVVLVSLLITIAATAGGLRISTAASLGSVLGQGAGQFSRRERTFGRSAIIAGQVAMAFVLALGGALLATSLWNVWQTDPGFQVAGTLFLDVRFTARIEPRVAVTRVFDLLEDLRRVDGVQAVAAVDTLFMSSASRGSPFRAPAGSATNQEPELLPVTPGYFDVANLRILAGRIPTDAELRTGDGLAVVSARAAQHFWPGISPLGQRLESDRGNVTVIGVVADGRYQKLDRESTGEIYAPLSMGLFGSVVPTFFIRTVGPGQRVMPGLIETVRRFDPTLQVRRAESVSWAMGETVKRRSFQAWLFGAFGAAGIVVAASGVFGMTAMSTRRRTREMGVRLAIGATPVRVVGLIMREQMLTVATGLIVGATIAAMAARYVAALLYGVPPFDPRVWIAAVLIIIVTAISGTLAPALWAARVDPARALRAE